MDPTEQSRRIAALAINRRPLTRSALERQYGRVWDLDELAADFVVTDFLAPLVFVRRKSDGVKGSLLFQHHPRLYWQFREMEPG